ncbi:hypothetical protein [Neisseria basseii]|uniref:hypothetical protein n=1 Tax=Neisseria basseii TaxID=2830650 RepID=UPI0026599747|nr:hypothetical protein [Neisseria basseii]
MPSENLSDGIFDALTVYRHRAGVGKSRTVIPDNTVILKPVIPAQAGIQACRCRNLSDKTVS